MPKYVFYIRMAIAISFILLAGCVIYFKEITRLTDMQVNLFAGLLFVYGIFRVYRAYKSSDDIYVEE